MDKKRFEDLYTEFSQREQELLNFKRGEYAGDVDVLKNFKQQALFNETTMLDICMVLAFKHIQGIQNIISGRDVRDLPWYWENGPKEGLKQRIADARNYLLLLAACIDESLPEKRTIYPNPEISSLHETKDTVVASSTVPVGPNSRTSTEFEQEIVCAIMEYSNTAGVYVGPRGGVPEGYEESPVNQVLPKVMEVVSR